MLDSVLCSAGGASLRKGVGFRLMRRKVIIGLISFIAISSFIAQRAHPEVSEFARQLTRSSHPLDLLFSLGGTSTSGDGQRLEDLNTRTLEALASCLHSNTCKENQASVVLLAATYFGNAVNGKVSGENIWAASVRDALHQLGYSFLYLSDLDSATTYYRKFPDLVKVVLAQSKDVKGCSKNPQCVKSALNPLGIPIWKIFSFHFWDGDHHPLGGPWTLSPEDYRTGNQYIGYSLEDTCKQQTFVPQEEREDQVYVLSKRLSHFHRRDYPWSTDALVQVAEKTNLTLIAGFRNDVEGASEPNGVINYGMLDKTAFFEHVSHSRALLGILHPRLSPSPYDALCFGVPFINPVDSWNRAHPTNRSRWNTQHNGLKYLEEPYVYHVFKGDTGALVRAVQAAKDNPIDRYIPPGMTRKALFTRVSYLVEHDWRSDAEELLASRLGPDGGSSLVNNHSEQATGHGGTIFLL
ncbi:glycosyltransferase family 18 protein [Calocera viscosa TUFC12733]|uniref:alpha-1,6-mannosyl-glycoprotein 6-beta-N-acetylglucosaminyltransferase n=1 Tax=Calocera viscosa (strain TUFC12733) TaxID=1330018 RepID=A0A167GQU8_CALVF|nr:glycosyltransferase family 18 protein [Calocera viscosa TUFC12733]